VDLLYGMKTHWLIRGLKFVLFAVAAILVFGFIVMHLWNWLMPSLFGWRLINFWQALGLLVLSRILFGGFRGRPAGHMDWRHRLMERWEHMTPEEREKFRAGLRRRWRPFQPSTPEEKA
jgi:hypothetical protein